MNNKPIITVACIGAGYFSQYHYDAWKRIPNVSLCGICNRTEKKAQQIAQQFSIPRYYNDPYKMLRELQPDIVDIITPPETHLAMVMICAEFGINAICQKPFGENLQQAQDMIRIADNAGIKLIVHENFRFMPWYRQIKTLIDNGFAGDILNVSFKLRPGDGQGDDAYLLRQPYFQTMEHFLIHETAIHLVDTFRYLFGEIASVFAHLRRCNPVIQGEDAGLVIFEVERNIQAIFDGNRLLDHDTSNKRRTMGELSIEGTQGSIDLNGEGQIKLRKFSTTETTLHEYHWLDQHFGGDCVYLFTQHVIEHFSKNTPIETYAKNYIRNIVIENAIYQSSCEHKVIFL